MAFRTVIINNRAKLEYSLNYLVCRKGNEEYRINLDEIKFIIINSTQVSITSSLISEATKKKIKIMFTDEKHNPLGEITPYQNNFYTYRKIKEQIAYSKEIMDFLWKNVVERKIINQARNLEYQHKEEAYQKLMNYASEVVDGDTSNREGHAAKVYFNSLFGKDFSRDAENQTNKYLNYGYAIILSSINREIKALGYLTELGIHHIGESNPFNLSCDFMEPLRPLIDSFVIKNLLTEDNYKSELIKVLSLNVKYCNKEIILDNALRLYVEDLFNFLRTGDMEKIRFIDYEL
jgi:CRISPR-associated endonuclease Cas1 subtype II